MSLRKLRRGCGRNSTEGASQSGWLLLGPDGSARPTPPTLDCTAHGRRFTGKINWVQLEVGTDDHDHIIDPEERLRIAIARQ